MLLMMFGPANKHTANDNTSGVITLCEIYFSMTEEHRKRSAFVFFDHEELGLFGSRFFKRKYKKEMKEKLLINFDCVSSGDAIMFIPNKKAEEKYGEKVREVLERKEEGKELLVEMASSTFYPSDQAGFPFSIGVAAFKKRKGIGLYIDKIHTRKDVEWDERNIQCLVERVIEFADMISSSPEKENT